jgi:hypothetical protein
MSSKLKVKTSFQSLNAWDGIIKCFELLDLLEKYEEMGLMPDRYGTSDRRTFALSDLSESQIQNCWSKVNGGIFKRKYPWHFMIMVFFMKTVPKAKITPISNLAIWIDAEYFSDNARQRRYIELCNDICSWGNMHYGFIALDQEYETKNSFGPGRGVGGANLHRGLPGIYWANFFGPEYAEWLGKERFTSIDVHRLEELPHGGWMVITRPDLLIWADPSIRENEQRIMNHLGRDAFFEMEYPDKPISIPPFLTQRQEGI